MSSMLTAKQAIDTDTQSAVAFAAAKHTARKNGKTAFVQTEIDRGRYCADVNAKLMTATLIDIKTQNSIAIAHACVTKDGYLVSAESSHSPAMAAGFEDYLYARIATNRAEREKQEAN